MLWFHSIVHLRYSIPVTFSYSNENLNPNFNSDPNPNSNSNLNPNLKPSPNSNSTLNSNPCSKKSKSNRPKIDKQNWSNNTKKSYFSRSTSSRLWGSLLSSTWLTLPSSSSETRAFCRKTLKKFFSIHQGFDSSSRTYIRWAYIWHFPFNSFQHLVNRTRFVFRFGASFAPFTACFEKKNKIYSS